MTSDACKAAYEVLYPNATKREAEEEKRGYTEQCYTAEQIREAFEDGWEACVAIATEAESAKAEAQRLAELESAMRFIRNHPYVCNRDDQNMTPNGIVAWAKRLGWATNAGGSSGDGNG